MKYRVLWAPYAEESLERMLAAAPHDDAVLAAAAREIDQHLLTEPLQFGESRYDAVRIGFVRPLGVQFEVLDDVATVVVHIVWRIDGKPGRLS
jgi:hypothetical protein